MVENVLPLFSQSFASAFEWLDRIMTQVLGWEFYLAAFTLTVAVRFFIKPLLGSGSSDRAQRRKEDE